MMTGAIHKSELDAEGFKQFGLSSGEDVQDCELYYRANPTDLSQYPSFATHEGQLAAVENSLVSDFPVTLSSQDGSDGLSRSTLEDSKTGQDENALREKKKAQNRAAQKAFRERREARVKELEARLKESEADRKALAEQLELLKRQNLMVENENRLLQQSGKQRDQEMTNSASVHTYSFPTQRQFFDSLTENKHGSFTTDEDRYLDNTGNEVLPLSAAWEYLHELSTHKNFDIYEVMKVLKGSEVCHGHGAAYPKALIDQAIQLTGAGWSSSQV